MGSSLGSGDIFSPRTANPAIGNCDELYELGLAFATGTRGTKVDLVSAHQWLNLAALGGSQAAQHCRADVAREMTTREIGEAQRRARTWLCRARMQ